MNEPNKLYMAKQLLTDRLLAPYRQRKLQNKNFTVICNNCLAAIGIYQKLGLQYTTPTVGLWISSEDYINFIEGFELYIKQPLTFKKTSKNPEINESLKTKPYPLGVLGEDIEIHFMHCETEDEAAEKWSRRVARINFGNLFFIYPDKYGFKEEFLCRYENLSYENKIFFSAKKRHSRLSIYIKEYEGQPEVGNSKGSRYYERYIDLIKWLNKEKDFLKKNKWPTYQ